MSPSPRRRRVRRAAVLTVAAAMAVPAIALAAPGISPGEGAVLNPELRTPDFTITGSAPGASLNWSVPGTLLSGSGPAPLDVEVDELGEGSYTLVAEEIGDPEPSTRSFTVDKTPPGVALTTPANGGQYQVGQQVLAAFSCSGGATACQGTVPAGSAINTSTLGAKSFTVTAEDAAGNTASQTVTYQVVDTIDPAISIMTPAQGATYQIGQPVKADFACTDAGSGIASCSGSVADGANIDTATTGTKTFTVTATDEAGNTATKSVQYEVVDTVKPAVTIHHPDEGATYQFGSTQTASYSCDDSGSGIATCSGTVPKGASIDTQTLGTRTFTVSATDKAGNTATTSVRYEVVDTVDPTVTIATPAANAKYEINSFQPADFTCQDAGSGVATCAGTVPKGSPVDTATLGAKTFTVTATDKAGSATIKSVDYTVVDTVDPTPPGLVSPPDSTVTNQLRPKLNWSASTDPGGGGASGGSGIDRYEVMLDGKQIAVVAPGGATSYTPDQDLAVAKHTWRVRAVDKAGNTALSELYGFTIDPNATPEPTITAGPPAFTNDATPTFSWTGQPSGVTEYRWAVKDGRATVADGILPAGTATVTPGPLADGAYVFTVTQRTNGDHGTPAARAFTVDTIAPGPLRVVVRPPGASGDTTPTFAWAGGESGAVFWWQLSGPGGVLVQGPTATAFNGAVLSVSPGAYVFQVRQTDAAGNAGPLSIPEPFTVVGGTPPPPPQPEDPPAETTPAEPAAPAPEVARDTAPKTTKQTPPTPATRNAKALLPRAGARIATVRPTLRWTPRKNATLYNVQVFRMDGATLTKVVTGFPKTTSYRVRQGKLRPGFRYVWRVWPYVGGQFSRQPLGVSYFDVAAGSGGAEEARLRRQLLINQRISQAAVRRLNAVQDWLDAGVTTADLAGGGLAAADFAAAVVTGPATPPHEVEPAEPRPVEVAAARHAAGATELDLSIAQLRINQRISAAAVRRANGLGGRLKRGLTGGDLRGAVVTLGKLEPSLRIVSSRPSPGPERSRTVVASAGGGGGRLTLSAAQLRINQRISQAAVRRANALIQKLEGGLSGQDFQDGSITAGNLAPAGQ